MPQLSLSQLTPYYPNFYFSELCFLTQTTRHQSIDTVVRLTDQCHVRDLESVPDTQLSFHTHFKIPCSFNPANFDLKDLRTKWHNDQCEIISWHERDGKTTNVTTLVVLPKSFWHIGQRQVSAHDDPYIFQLCCFTT